MVVLNVKAIVTNALCRPDKMAKKAKPAEVPREGVNTRITRDLREKLDAAAAAAGRSTGSEIERRLERSFRFRDELLDVLADPRTLNAAVVIAMTWMDFEDTTGLPWYKNRETLLAAQSSAMSVLSSWRSADGETIERPEDAERVRDERDKMARMLGITLADRMKHRVSKRDVPEEVHGVISSLGANLFGEHPSSKRSGT
jgi:hypothetical protein